ncbi:MULTISPECIES: hypothetical protein [Kitasatospora]|uniref:hypothetical protein n=1 Tax=Kitasatospora TaxID=2063 RepID=UPI0011C3D9CE|nr:hypothetical protein [Kitasatospora xanthocidica]
MIENRVFADVLIEGLDDWVPIDRLLWAAKEGAAGRPWQAFFVELLHFLVGNGSIRIGELAEEGFEAWNGGTDEIVQLVVDDLERLDWDPRLGSRAWISNTGAGDELARSLTA